MPWRSSSVTEERIGFVMAARRQSQSLSELCRRYRVSRPTGYRWLRRYEEVDSLTGLVERSRRPHRSPARVSEDVTDRIVAMRLTWDWGARKLRTMLHDDGVIVSESTINRVLRRHDLVRESQSHLQGTTRFEREQPNQLWQMDFKGKYRCRAGCCYPLAIIDDHSRFAVGLYALGDQHSVTVSGCLRRTFERYGVPDAILMDHGIPWWGTSNGHGLTRLSVALIRQGIRVLFSGIRHPQTQGKVERFHRTLGRRVDYHGWPQTLSGWQAAFDEFLEEYNYVRPHEALAMAVPATRYRPSRHAYRAMPDEWTYPEGATVARLNSQGSFDWSGGRYFVCEALADERVQLEPCEGKLLVRYRHLIVREIDLTTGRSLPLVLQEQNAYA
jgi:transposase InsO family protein